MSIRSRVLLVALALAHPLGLSGQAPVPTTTTVAPMRPGLVAIRDTVEAWIARREIPSMAIVVAEGDSIIWDEGLGYADREAGVVTNTSCTYPLGSLAKALSATVMLTLVEAGRIGLDDPIAPALAPLSLPADAGPIDGVTVRRILNASAGLPHGWMSYDRFADYPSTPAARAAMVRTIAPVVFAPGETWEYSNVSLGMVQFVAEGLTGERYGDLVRRVLFRPLGMDSSYADVRPDLYDHVVSLYDDDGQPINGGFAAPVGGLFAHASAHDLYRFGRMVLGRLLPDQRPVLSDSSRALMLHYAGGPRSPYALGWWRGDERIVVDGQVGGANAHLSMVPSHGVVTVCLLNQTSNGYGRADQICDAITSVLVPELAGNYDHALRDFQATFATPYEAGGELTGQWTGTITTVNGPLPVTLTFAATGPPTIAIDGGAPLALTNTIFNKVGRFKGSFERYLPTPENRDGHDPAQARLSVSVRGDRAEGYIQARFATERGNFAIPLFVRLARGP